VPVPINPTEEIRKKIKIGAVLLVAGSGISISASSDPDSGLPHPQSFWAGLLENGLQWLKEHKHMDPEDADAHLRLLTKIGGTHNFISAAEDIVRKMGGCQSEHFAMWLRNTVGSIKPTNRAVLDAIENLRKHGNLVATTNYDDLLINANVSSVSWRQPEEFLRAVRNRDNDKIIFLHGSWRDPQSIILDWNSYEKILNNQAYRSDLAAVWQMTTWVFIGSGVSGLDDPEFSMMLERYGKRIRQADLWDFCLVRNVDQQEFQAFFDNKGVNICAVGFGDSFDDLPGYLTDLLPAIIPNNVDGRIRKKIPAPPTFYAEPEYIGSHRFFGRKSQLQDLSEWAKSSDPNNLMLFEAIGGNGKSMLTWEWCTKFSKKVREDWAGIFWYSFYERGAVMADFCQRAIAYMTGTPLDDIKTMKTAELKDWLISELKRKPWLLILDGLERVLVAYHRIDAAEISDEEAEQPKDKIANRNPCDTIRDEDNDLLRALTASAPSKILVTSRLTPRILLNPSGQPVNGVKRSVLPGLRPVEAEQLFRSCGIVGDGNTIQTYLSQNCDNHPLVIGALAGLINGYLPDRGNFDVWVNDPNGGGELDFANLDLTQRRNHILHIALASLHEKGKQLLSTLALVSESVDYTTLCSLNPYLPPEPAIVHDPEKKWRLLSEEELEIRREELHAMSPEEQRILQNQQTEQQRSYEIAVRIWKEYQVNIARWKEQVHSSQNLQKLTALTLDLEQRGLIQYDSASQRYDLHPVVRYVVLNTATSKEKSIHGKRVVDYFSTRPHNPYREAETIQDVTSGLTVVRTLVKLKHFQDAVNSYKGDLADALAYNLEAHVETLSLLMPMFPNGIASVSQEIDLLDAAYIARHASIALASIGEYEDSISINEVSIDIMLSLGKWDRISVILSSMTHRCFLIQNRIATADRIDTMSLYLANASKNNLSIFLCLMRQFYTESRLGKWEIAEETWNKLDVMGREWSRCAYRQGMAEECYTLNRYWQGTLQNDEIAKTIDIATKDNNRTTIRNMIRLQGRLALDARDWESANSHFQEAVRMARERSVIDNEAETGLAIAKWHLQKLSNPTDEAARLALLKNPSYRLLAELWLAIGNKDEARINALRAFDWAVADGTPYVHYHELLNAKKLLISLNIPIPNVKIYSEPGRFRYPWEERIVELIRKLETGT